jgi:UDP-2,3-diacylglucosamine pyrophosphatase LpxH
MSGPAFFASDLHLFARRSEAPLYLAAMRHRAARAKLFVLGGDIFDFRWSTLASTRHTVEAAIEWLRELAGSHAKCHFHYLLGNHDYHRHFLSRLYCLELETPNLTCHPYFFRQGGAVFLHGDVADRRMTPVMLAAACSRWLEDRPRGRLRHRMYDVAVGAGLHRALPYLAHPKRLVARRILSYLRQIDQGPEHGVRNIYFGHIHRQMADYRYGGLAFHNGGAPIKGQRFRILEAEVS